MDGKLQANDLFEMAYLELALHFFILHHVDVLKLNLRSHFIFIFKTYLKLDIINQFLLIATLKPRYTPLFVPSQVLSGKG
jgi:hypothetical protein